ncbi:MAG TPA: hypothetical protein VIH87_00120 [Methylocella sp.]
MPGPFRSTVPQGPANRTPKKTVDRLRLINAALVDAFADEHAGRLSPPFKSIDEFQAGRNTEEYKKFIGQK